MSDVIGTIREVYPSNFIVKLLDEAPSSVALRPDGQHLAFPTLNSYLVVPCQGYAILGQVEFVKIQEQAYRKTKRAMDDSLIELPFPERHLRLVPLATLHQEGDAVTVERGVEHYPSVGDTVRLPQKGELKALFEPTTSDDSPATIAVGTAPTAGGFPVLANIDTLLNTHLAVLGNTGGGKSCTVAGIIQELHNPDYGLQPRVVIFDPNGEYQKAFEGIDGVSLRVLRPNADSEDFPISIRPLRMPCWIWTIEEWTSILMASPRAQLPVLQHALNELSSAGRDSDAEIGDALTTDLAELEKDLLESADKFNVARSIAKRIRLAVVSILESYSDNLNSEPTTKTALKRMLSTCLIGISAQTAGADETADQLCDRISKKLALPTKYDEGFSGLHRAELRVDAARVLKFLDKISSAPSNEAKKSPFGLSEFLGVLSAVSRQSARPQDSVTMLHRLQALNLDPGITQVIDCFSFEEGIAEEAPTSDAIEKYLLGGIDGHGIAIVDLSMVPPQLQRIIASTYMRLILERAKESMAKPENERPATLIVLDEAHTLIAKRSSSNDGDQDAVADAALKTFEKVAREGRKYGLSLLVASQRPVELSPTVLSQCNSFIIHRLVNDRDQETVKKLVPDAVSHLLNGLPGLPTQYAMFVGLAAKFPTLLRTRNIAPEQRPRSENPRLAKRWMDADVHSADSGSIAIERTPKK